MTPRLSLWKGVVWAAPQPPTMADIAEDVAARHKVTLAEMRTPSRERRLAWARQEAWGLMAEQKRWSTPVMARFLGRTDHTTVLHGVRAWRARQAAAAQA